ncbi:MAG TPA: hypothetical protein VF816_09325 [Rhodocyclaceae bacterium]
MGEGFEVDFLGTGGGAICVRYGAPGQYRVMIYECATREAGEAAVEHVRRRYETDRVDFLVASNPDVRRTAGLEVILDELEVGQFWMHRPWEHSEELFLQLVGLRPPGDVAGERLKWTLAAMFDLQEIAAARGIRVLEPFKGAQIGAFHVMSPDQEWYAHSLLPRFVEAPGDDAATSARNESSVVLIGEIGDRKLLLTGDAGVRALTATADYAKAVGVSLPRTLDFVQIPHGGCREHVSPGVLDRLIGSKRKDAAGERPRTAFVLTADSTALPHETAVEGFRRRGWKVVGTGGQCIRYGAGMPDRTA